MIYHFSYIFLAGDETLWKRVSLIGNKNVPNGTIGTLLTRGVSYLKLSKATLCTPIMENKFGCTYKSIIPSKLIYLGIIINTLYEIYFSKLLGNKLMVVDRILKIRVLKISWRNGFMGLRKGLFLIFF